MRKLIFLLLFVVFSCTGSGRGKTPENIISPQQMSDIMVDIVLMKNIKRNRFAIKEKQNLLVDQYLYDKYGIDSFQLAISQEYYAKNPKKYIPIFKEVQNKIKKIKDSLQVIMTKFDEE